MKDLTGLFQSLGLDPATLAGGSFPVRTPIDGSEIARLAPDTPGDVGAKVGRAQAAFAAWRVTPGPARGELVRLFGEELRAHKDSLGELVTVETGKILEEGKGEVQEMIDICDFAVGLSRQLYGLTIASERPGHKMMESWHPLGPVGVITAFNFPVAPWAWNFALALVCGDPMVWKPSELTPLSALACRNIFEKAAARFGAAPDDLLQIVVGGKEAGEALVDDARVPLISATGSCAMGRAVGARVAVRLGRSLLELGGNNGMIVAPSADLDLAERAILFAAVGTAGQRCTSLRRLIVHEDVYDALLPRLKSAYASVAVGEPLDRLSLRTELFGQGGLSGSVLFGRAVAGDLLGGAALLVVQADGRGAHAREATPDLLDQIVLGDDAQRSDAGDARLVPEAVDVEGVAGDRGYADLIAGVEVELCEIEQGVDAGLEWCVVEGGARDAHARADRRRGRTDGSRRRRGDDAFERDPRDTRVVAPLADQADHRGGEDCLVFGRIGDGGGCGAVFD